MPQCVPDIFKHIPVFVFTIFVYKILVVFACKSVCNTCKVVTIAYSQAVVYCLIGMSACLAGAVAGDHCSPISDTTIMSSAGTQCDHLSHVSTQLPYVLTVSAVSFAAFLLAGFVYNWFIVFPLALGSLFVTMLVIKKRCSKCRN